MVTTAGGVSFLERVWRRQEKIPGLTLAEPDEARMALDLAVRSVPSTAAILEEQRGRFMNPDRKARFEFVMPALSVDPATRDAFFQSLADVENRRREPWVVEGVSYLNHPLRGAQSEKYMRPALDLLPEIQRTGDIFFPKNWMDATLERSQQPSGGGHRADVSRRASGCSRSSPPHRAPIGRHLVPRLRPASAAVGVIVATIESDCRRLRGSIHGPTQLSPSSRGPGRGPFTPETRVRIPLGTPIPLNAETVDCRFIAARRRKFRSARLDPTTWPDQAQGCFFENCKRRPLARASLRNALVRSRAYWPVLTYWMQSPWFLKDVKSLRTRFCHAPFLQLAVVVGRANVVNRTAGVYGAHPVSNRKVPTPPAPHRCKTGRVNK